MSLGSEDYTFENEKESGGVELKRKELNRHLQSAPHLRLRPAPGGYISGY